jgi:peptide/nickel transport system substrate-binding protein
VDLQRFEEYWGGPPAIGAVHVLPPLFGSPAADLQVPRGAPLVFYAVPGSPAFERAMREHVLHEGPGVSIQYLAFDLRPRESPGVRLPPGAHGNPFTDIRVRRAVALAIDYERMRSDVFGGRARTASQMVAPAVLGFDPTLPPPRHDVPAARRLMAESAYPQGFEVDLDARELVDQYRPHVVDGLAAIGIRVRVHTFADQAFFDHLRAGRSSLYVLRFSCRTGDAQLFLDNWLHSRDAARGLGVFNYSYEASPVPGLDQQIEEARHTLEAGTRLERLQALMRRVMDERLLVPLLSERTLVFVSRGIDWTPRADTFRLFAEMRPRP